MGMMPFLRFSMRFSSTSSAATLFPRPAKQDAVTKPTYPTPTTQICFIVNLFCFRLLSNSRPIRENDYPLHDPNGCGKLQIWFQDRKLLLCLFVNLRFKHFVNGIQEALHMNGLRKIPITTCIQRALAVTW